ncbi:MAG: hypothetical protein ABEK16_04650 [Candidatus Nanohalobium sp.]
MIAADTSSLIPLASVELLEVFLEEFEVATTEKVVEELEETTRYDDRHGEAAEEVLDNLQKMEVCEVEEVFESCRIDSGEGSVAGLANGKDADFMVTDDFRALPELQKLVDARVAISPIALKALIKREILEEEEALDKLEELAEQLSWMGAPLYRHAQELFKN